MTKEEKKTIVLEVSKKLNISVISASKLLQENKWKIEKILPEEKKKKKTAKTKKRKVKSLDIHTPPPLIPEDVSINGIKKKKVPEDKSHFNYDLYLENCEKYRKHPEQIPEVTQIGEGFWTMAEIVKYVKYLKTKNK